MLQVFGETFFAKIVNAQQKRGQGVGKGGRRKKKEERRREKWKVNVIGQCAGSVILIR